jgi:hypothetical protein
MKKLALLLLIVLFAATYTLSAQKTFSGVIQYEMKLEGTDDPNLLASMENLVFPVTILGNKSKSVMRPNDYVEIMQIWDGDKGTSMTVLEITGLGKFYRKWDAEQHKDKLKLNDHSFSYENEWKDILGYKCQKVIATITNLEDDSQTEMILYVTKDIGSPKLNGSDLPGLEGFPLMQINPMNEFCDGCAVVSEAIKITPKKLKDVDFLLPSDAKRWDEDPDIKEMLKEVFGN